MEATVCATHGAMGSVLRKLGALLSDEYKLLTSVKGDIMFLKAELESIHAFLKKISEFEDPDELSKCWIKAVRELSYDIEGGIDSFMLSLGVESSRKRQTPRLQGTPEQVHGFNDKFQDTPSDGQENQSSQTKSY